MTYKKFLNISRSNRISYTIKHHHMHLSIKLSGSMIHKNQFIKALQTYLKDILNADNSTDVVIEVLEVDSD